jgi:hypothetical protein
MPGDGSIRTDRSSHGVGLNMPVQGVIDRKERLVYAYSLLGPYGPTLYMCMDRRAHTEDLGEALLDADENSPCPGGYVKVAVRLIEIRSYSLELI